MFLAIGIGEFMFLLALIVVLLSITVVDVVTLFTRAIEGSLVWLGRVVTGNTGDFT